MRATIASPGTCANSGPPKAGPSKPRTGATNFAIIRKIKEISPRDTVKSVAEWLDLTWKTAKNRVQGQREFSLDEVADLLVSEHGFAILSAIMREATQRPGYRVPDWWEVCEPLMGLADAERLCAAMRKKTERAIQKREDVVDALETEIRRAQAAVIHSPKQSRGDGDAVGAHVLARHRVVAAGRRR